MSELYINVESDECKTLDGFEAVYAEYHTEHGLNADEYTFSDWTEDFLRRPDHSEIRSIPMSRVRSANHDNEGHWFDKSNISFFNSSYPRTATLFKNVAYFVTGEQYSADTERLYTVRSCDMSTGVIDTIGEFQQYRTQTKAKDAIDKMLGV